MKKNKFHTIIIGSGAAGLNCALEIEKKGIDPKEIAIFTEKLGGGTSFNAGSDKQTYYKLSLIGNNADSPIKMAHSLFDGGSMHGDIALIESSCSTQAFMNLVNIGVPFPHDEFGAYVGFKTDNDPLQRGTSAGPLTSNLMGNSLLNVVRRKGIEIYDNNLVLKIVKDDNNNACGILSLNLEKIKKIQIIKEKDLQENINSFQSSFLILATGGPTGMYKYSVYPKSQWGSTSLAINEGVKLQNLTESQYGLASLKFPWNVSGTYQQVIPRYISVANDEDPLDPNTECREFLINYFPDISNLINAIFLKGYQWPFNVERISNFGSSLIDLAVFIEKTTQKRKIFIDFLNNPEGFSWQLLGNEAKSYLENSGATQKLPIDRLNHMNPEAINVYLRNSIDLNKEPLEIDICAQHCNGGVVGDRWWQTNIPRLFAIGEVNGSHGVHRPGGSALNSGQVGGIRASEKIIYGKWDLPIKYNEFNEIAQNQKKNLISFLFKLVNNEPQSSQSNYRIMLKKIQDRMMVSGAYFRNSNEIKHFIQESRSDLSNFSSKMKIKNGIDLIKVWKTLDALICQLTFLVSIDFFIQQGGGSRGSFLVITDQNENELLHTHPLLEKYFIRKENLSFKEKIVEISAINDRNLDYKFENNLISRRPIPENTPWFENIWKNYKKKEFF
ncbi:MAG: FAD-binding protein [archaeon]|nr:FAD-binding protein [archaeon]